MKIYMQRGRVRERGGGAPLVLIKFSINQKFMASKVTGKI